MFQKQAFYMFTSLLGALLFSFTVSSRQAQAKEVSVVIYIDQSNSMVGHARKMAGLVGHIADRLEKACGQYRIGVSDISFADRKAPPRIIGDPKFITKEHGSHGVKILEDRILNLVKTLYPYKEERTYSSIASSMEIERREFATSDFVATLLVSDATPSFETDGAKGSLERIFRFIPKAKFLGVGLLPDYIDAPACRLDQDPKHLKLLTEDEIHQPKLFFRGSGGYTADICVEDLAPQIDEFLTLVITSAQCQLTM